MKLAVLEYSEFEFDRNSKLVHFLAFLRNYDSHAKEKPNFC